MNKALDYLSQFRYRFTLEEHAAMAEFEMEFENLSNGLLRAPSVIPAKAGTQA